MLQYNAPEDAQYEDEFTLAHLLVFALSIFGAGFALGVLVCVGARTW